MTALSKKLEIAWPHNGLRHSYISYRLAIVKDAAKVALEAGNSPDIIFKVVRYSPKTLGLPMTAQAV